MNKSKLNLFFISISLSLFSLLSTHTPVQAACALGPICLDPYNFICVDDYCCEASTECQAEGHGGNHFPDCSAASDCNIPSTAANSYACLLHDNPSPIYCCAAGYIFDGTNCVEMILDPTPTPIPASPPTTAPPPPTNCGSLHSVGECESVPGCDWIGSHCTQSTPENLSGSLGQIAADIGLNTNLTTIDGIINSLLPILMVFSGIVLFLMLIASGFQLLTSANNPEAAAQGKQRATMAIVGFLIIFASYWITQILQVVFGINIL